MTFIDQLTDLGIDDQEEIIKKVSRHRGTMIGAIRKDKHFNRTVEDTLLMEHEGKFYRLTIGVYMRNSHHVNTTHQKIEEITQDQMLDTINERQ